MMVCLRSKRIDSEPNELALFTKVAQVLKGIYQLRMLMPFLHVFC